MTINLQNNTLLNTVPELNMIHAYGNKTAIRIVEACRNPTRFINPAQHFTAKQKPVLVKVTGHNKMMRFHGQ
jgi:hypothetical protein